jgi:predicted DNA binding CopG/RHH family protein
MSRKRNTKRKFVLLDRTRGGDFDWSRAARVAFPNLKTSSTTISIRVPDPMLDHIKALANKRDVPYQSLIKMMLAESIEVMR